MSAKAGKRPLRSLTAHEKLEAIRRVHDGESKASVARDIGVPESTLRGWCKNEEKISYISRQSSPDTDDSIHFEPKEKKPKLEDTSSPFNLSLKPNSRVSYSPNSDLYKGEIYPKTDSFKVEEKPLNLNAKIETPKTERERNRAELARLSIELGLNRPEMYPAATGNIDLTNMNLLTQWNNLLMQQKPKKAAADSSNMISSSQPLLTTYKPEKVDNNKLGKIEQPKSVEDSVWYWLKTQQAMLGLSQNQNLNLPSSTSQLPSNSSNDQNSSWFWKWYKQYTQQLQSPQQNDKILYQQLTKDKDSENLKVESEKPKSSNKARAVLDNLLLNNNNNVAVNKKEKEEDLSQSEALEHGEKFLKWLECCSEPSVTAMQILQFRGLINNIKTGVDRKNGDVQKAKVRRK